MMSSITTKTNSQSNLSIIRFLHLVLEKSKVVIFLVLVLEDRNALQIDFEACDGELQLMREEEVHLFGQTLGRQTWLLWEGLVS